MVSSFLWRKLSSWFRGYRVSELGCRPLELSSLVVDDLVDGFFSYGRHFGEDLVLFPLSINFSNVY
jgi:hypothetical protein